MAPLTLVLHVLFTYIAAWNIVNSIFIEKVLSLGRPEVETQMLEKHKKDIKDAEELMTLIRRADQDKSGKLSMDEFVFSMNDPKFRYFFEIRGLEIKDAEMFFHMLTAVTGEDEIDISTFVSGCLGMQGLASSVDLHALSFEVKVMHVSHREFIGRWESEVSSIRAALDDLATIHQP